MQWRGPLPWLAAAFAADVVAIIGATYALSRGPVDASALTALALVALAGAAVLFVLAWKVVDTVMVRSVRRLAAEVRAIAFGGARQAVDLGPHHVLAPLPEAVNDLCGRLVQARSELADGLGAATARAEEDSARLAAILNDLHEAVVVCNQRHQVVLYNQVATHMLAGAGQLGLMRSLFETVARPPVVHMLAMLTNRPEMAGRGTPFLAGSADGHMLLQARMTLIRAGGSAASRDDCRAPRDGDGGVTGYVVTLVDAGPQVAALARRDALLRDLGEELEGTLDRLRAAGDGSAVQREANRIGAAMRRITDSSQRAMGEWWPMTDLPSADLFEFVARRIGDGGPKVTATGLPAWLHGDSQSLALALEALIRRIAAQAGPDQAGTPEIDLSAGSAATSYAEEHAPRACDDIAWLDLRWRGEPVGADVLAGWLRQRLPDLADMTVADVLAHHAGAGVTQGYDQGWVSLRLPMRPRVEVRFKRKAPLPQRPEFYDLSLLAQARDTGALGGTSLRTLTYVVFDTETTGLEPSAGDQIVQIGAVRVVNGRILSGETFNRIVNPGRPIPPDSIRFHGITDDMARDKPPLPVVLPQFKAFAADAVLVAHNAAFDLKFLRLRERECGIAFDNPVLDTMLLSGHLDGAEAGHSLDDICSRLGIEITERHTALGDAMVTAAVLLHQIEALEARGITTLDQAVTALDLTMVLHQRQQAL